MVNDLSETVAKFSALQPALSVTLLTLGSHVSALQISNPKPSFDLCAAIFALRTFAIYGRNWWILALLMFLLIPRLVIVIVRKNPPPPSILIEHITR